MIGVTRVDPEELRDRIAKVSGAALLGVGDNVLDCYLHEDLAYPGGNALNVAVYTKLLLGAPASFIGIVGQDRFGEHLIAVLDHLGIETTLCRRAQGPTGMAFVELDAEGDRIFVASNRGGVQRQLRIRLSDDDLNHAAKFKGVHTSTYSGIDTDLHRLADVVPVSYDFSDEAHRVVQLAHLVQLGFVSGSHLSGPEVDELGEAAIRAGMEHLVVTLGARGSVSFTQQGRAEGTVFAVEAVDALGAGDAFISGYVSAYRAGGDAHLCLEVGAAAGALACTLRGAFGYPTLAGVQARDQLAHARQITDTW